MSNTLTIDRIIIDKILTVLYSSSCQLSTLPVDKKKKTVEGLHKISDTLWDTHNLLKDEINMRGKY